jgi:hypothetical protein
MKMKDKMSKNVDMKCPCASHASMAVTSIQEKGKSIVAGALCMHICNENASPLVDLWSRFLSQFYSFNMLNMLNIAPLSPLSPLYCP